MLFITREIVNGIQSWLDGQIQGGGRAVQLALFVGLFRLVGLVLDFGARQLILIPRVD